MAESSRREQFIESLKDSQDDLNSEMETPEKKAEKANSKAPNRQ